MDLRTLSPEGRKALEQVLGYVNFSSGNPDVAFLANLNLLCRPFAETQLPPVAPGLFVPDLPPAYDWKGSGKFLRESLAVLESESPALRDAEQARAVLGLVFDHVLPGYLAFHRDLLFHQSGETMFNAFFIGRVCEAVLREGGPWEQAERITRGAIKRLNDYVGYRPVPQLEGRKTEPFPHEFVRPVPLYIRGAGAAHGPHRVVVERAIKLLEETDEDLLRSASFDPAALEELAFDPRAYDFDHPVNKRPNYHFGQWDPHLIDQQGRYRRYVMQQVTLESLTNRLRDPQQESPPDELLFEAASVLAGTVLMASGISGSGPETHDSSVTLATLLTQIAKYRDQFYERLVTRLPAPHRSRLLLESKERRQPFGSARQHLNAQLARRRASQLEHVQLARIFARMGYPGAATKQANVVPTASARMSCQIDCWITEANLLIDKGQLDVAATLPAKIRGLLIRGIECGAIIDPWNILGFDCQFSLFPAVENSVIDHRAEELVELMQQVFAIYSRIWSEAAAKDNTTLCERISGEFQDLCEWWRRFAAHEVSSVEAIDSLDAYRAAEHVANALNLWHKGGAATGDVAFWAPHANMFDSPKAYALVVDALLARGDFVASMALLMHWVGQGETIQLEKGDSSFYELAERWLLMVRRTGQESLAAADKAWQMCRKFFDYFEANAETFWSPPQFELGGDTPRPKRPRDDDLVAGIEDDEEQDEVFSAAYEDMVYRDSTDDGVEGSVFDTRETTDDELERESRRIEDRLAFQNCLARLWRFAAVSPRQDVSQTDRIATMRRWAEQASENRRGLMELLDTVHEYRLALPTTEHSSLVEYDRRRMIKESLLERIISTCVETVNAGRLLLAAAASVAKSPDAELKATVSQLDEDERLAIESFASILRRDTSRVRSRWQALLHALGRKPLLYVPLSKGGQPRDIVAARIRQHTIQDLLMWLPRLGMLIETCRLIETARQMEQNNPVGPGAVTEFDELFKIGCRSLVESLIESARTWPELQSLGEISEDGDDEHPLVESLEMLTEAVLKSWLNHSRTLRLSVLERVDHERDWKRLVSFIKRYGDEIFTQRFLNLGNVRAIMHQGVDTWIKQIEAEPTPDCQFRLLDEIDREKGIVREEAVEMLSLALEAVIENYGEYRDYNSTTTQSDRGEMLYTLLDFLRLRAKYDRVCWNLKPVILAHDTLLRFGETTAARIWRGALTERVAGESEQYLSDLAKLQKKYAMRMPTVADRLAERFIRPMAIDSIRALVEAAINEAKAGGDCPHFEMLDRETEVLAREPTGVGLDIPAWIMALQEEVERARRPIYEKNLETDLATMIPSLPLSRDETRRQLEEWGREK